MLNFANTSFFWLLDILITYLFTFWYHLLTMLLYFLPVYHKISIRYEYIFNLSIPEKFICLVQKWDDDLNIRKIAINILLSMSYGCCLWIEEEKERTEETSWEKTERRVKRTVMRFLTSGKNSDSKESEGKVWIGYQTSQGIK